MYAFVVGFFASIYKFFDFGELNNVQNESVGPCSEDWLINFLNKIFKLGRNGYP